MGNGRGQYGKPIPLRGGSLRGSWARGGHHAFHGEEAPIYGSCGYRIHNLAIGDRIGLLHPIQERTQVVDQLKTEIATLHNELMREMGLDPSALDPMVSMQDPQRYLHAVAQMEKSPLFPIWRDVFSPFLKEWNAFARNYSEWSEALWLTNWDRFVNFKDRWHAVYEKVAKAVADRGGRLAAPPPQDIPEDVLDRIHNFFKKAGGAVEEVWDVTKIAVYGGLAIGGVFVISKLIEDFRSK